MKSDELYAGIIYKYTSPSGKVYIGQTMNERKRRSDFLCSTIRYSGPKIENARKKYGPENFQYEVLFRVESYGKEEIRSILNEKEKEYIQLFDSVNNGYNIDEGGAFKDSSYIHIETEETRQLRSIQMKERWENGFKGCSDNPSAIQKMKDKLSIAILQYDIQGNFISEWKSATEAGRVLGVKNSLITKVCKRQNWICRGFIFVYKSDYPSVPQHIDTSYIPEKYRMNPDNFKRGGNAKVLYQYNLDGKLVRKYSSAKQASEELEYNYKMLCKYIKNNECFKGFLFTYEQL